MGTGKSTIGRILADRLQLPFFDSDTEVEKAAGCSVRDIFSHYGEQFFRDGERRVIKRLLKKDTCVIAAGGGAFMDDTTRDLISRYALSIWLYASPKSLSIRLKNLDSRPLLDGENIFSTLKALSRKRDPIYSKADISFDSSKLSPNKVADSIIAAIN